MLHSLRERNLYMQWQQEPELFTAEMFGQHLWADFWIDLGLSLVGTLVVSFLVYQFVNHRIVKRIERAEPVFQQFGAGDFRPRLEMGTTFVDEIDLLWMRINRMAESLEDLHEEQETRVRVREQAIIEERERIARELHDGLAQLLGYVNTKTIAARLMLKRERYAAAEENLVHLEKAAQELFLDTREAILGLKLSSQTTDNGQTERPPFCVRLQDYLKQYTMLAELPVTYRISESTQNLRLPVETELQLLRIVQEALTNVRKHAQANQVQIGLSCNEEAFNIVIHDNGIGFNPETRYQNGNGTRHYGLKIMEERATSIKAYLDVNSEYAQGTRVQVRLPLEEVVA